jgi:membrane AbrB-like protein
MAERAALLLAAGTLGASLWRHFRLPGGAFLGALLPAAILSLWLDDPQPLPEGVRWMALLLLGTYTGSTVDRRVLRQIRTALPVAMAGILALIAVAVALGWMLHSQFAGEIGLGTVVLGTMPGGASGLSAVAYDLGADARLVASLHMVRQFMVFGALPLVLRWLAGFRQGKEHAR